MSTRKRRSIWVWLMASLVGSATLVSVGTLTATSQDAPPSHSLVDQSWVHVIGPDGEPVPDPRQPNTFLTVPVLGGPPPQSPDLTALPEGRYVPEEDAYLYENVPPDLPVGEALLYPPLENLLREGSDGERCDEVSEASAYADGTYIACQLVVGEIGEILTATVVWEPSGSPSCGIMDWALEASSDGSSWTSFLEGSAPPDPDEALGPQAVYAAGTLVRLQVSPSVCADEMGPDLVLLEIFGRANASL